LGAALAAAGGILTDDVVSLRPSAGDVDTLVGYAAGQGGLGQASLPSLYANASGYR
jgi:hypothetical protein